jgi:hypothetical protein
VGCASLKVGQRSCKELRERRNNKQDLMGPWSQYGIGRGGRRTMGRTQPDLVRIKQCLAQLHTVERRLNSAIRSSAASKAA